MVYRLLTVVIVNRRKCFPEEFMKFIYLLCMTIAIVQSSFAMIDMNSNGMSDIWERKYQVVGASPSADLDNDDQSNLAESLAGTNPNSDQSVPATLLANYKPSAPYVSWLSQLGVKYQVESSVSLVDGSWVNEGNEIIGLGGQMVTTVDAISGPRKFFRIKVVGDASSAVDQQIQGLLHDTDGDGLSDLSEILSGTDTFDPKSNWQSTSLAIGASTEITWKSEQGKYYQFMSRMSSGDPWINEGGLIMGTGDEMNVSFVEPSQTQREYTVTVSDKDSDGDGLNDWEEFQLGLEINFVRSDVVQGTDDMEYIQNRVNQPIVIQVEAEEAVANVTRVTKGGVRVYRTGGFDAGI